MRTPAQPILHLAAGVLAAMAVTAQQPTAVPRAVTEHPWNARWGNHRARIRVDHPADAVRLHLPWRRRDPEPAAKAVWIIDPESGKRLQNVACVRIERESGDVVMQPPQAGEFHVYYMPFAVTGSHFPTTHYDAPDNTADAAWLARHGLDAEGLAAGRWRALPAATVLDFEARTEFDRMDPMEVIATAAETKALLAAHPGRAYLLFPEDRTRPIRMPHDLPQCWIGPGPGKRFEGRAAPNEYYVFQIGLYAARDELRDVTLRFSNLVGEGGAAIPSLALTCFNAGGTDWAGRPFSKSVTVPQGDIQALWCGVDVPTQLAPGNYTGQITVQPAGLEAQQVAMQLTIAGEPLADRGDGDLWRLSRLRWLNSTIGLDDTVTAPYTPLGVESNTAGCRIACLGRRVTFGNGGLPASIRVGDAELLAGPVTFTAAPTDGALAWTAEPARVTKHSDATVTVESTAAAPGIRLRARTAMDFDGYLNVQLSLTAEQDLELADCHLEIPLRQAFATYMMGMGCKGGKRPAKWHWQWDQKKHQDSVWVGDVAGGLQCKLKGPNYRWPLVNIHYHRRPLVMPEGWYNNGKGGCHIEAGPDGAVVIRAFSGPRRLTAGEELRFDAGLLITPMKPLDPKAHWRQRYYHSGLPDPEQVAARGANIINIHHATPVNPFINYPFLRTRELGDYIRQAHDHKLKVKLYYTIRELTNHLPELWALRSLGDEIYADGPGGGYAWLHEHLADHYSPAWHHPFPDGTWCSSISQTGLSRWHNYYLEGFAWLLRNVELDGLYLDEIGYDREIMRRLRRVLDRYRPEALLDLHSWNHFNGRAGWANCLNLYMEHMPYLDSLWIGEGRNYNEGPDHWLVEISGIPFGLFSEMLQGGGNPWRGMLYGMTNRMPWSGDPSPIWKLWDSFGIQDAEMLGYWGDEQPVRTGHDQVLATVYRRPERSLVCLASWAANPVNCQLQIDWPALGLDPAKAMLYAPDIGPVQSEDLFAPGEAIPVLPGKGWMLVVDETLRQRLDPAAAYAGRTLLFEEQFTGADLDASWQVVRSTRPETEVAVDGECLRINCTANTCAFAERPLPPGTELVECELNNGTDGGQSWGVGVGLVWPGRFLRVHLRAEDRRFGYDDTGNVMFGPPAVPGTWQRVRLRLEKDEVILEGAAEGARRFRTIGKLPRSRFPGDPTTLRLGKMNAAGQNTDFPKSGARGTCRIRRLRVFGKE